MTNTTSTVTFDVHGETVVAKLKKLSVLLQQIN